MQKCREKNSKPVPRKTKQGAASFSYAPTAPLKVGDFADDPESRAVLTHWLQNLGTKAARPYQERALALLPGWARDLTSEEFMVAEGSLPPVQKAA